jgi:hypothetical protein
MAAAAPKAGKLFFCCTDGCVGTLEAPSLACVLCEAPVHTVCFRVHVRKLKEYPITWDNDVFCGAMCCGWHGDEKSDPKALRSGRLDLMKFTKAQLKALAVGPPKVKMTSRVGGVSRDLPKETMVRKLNESKMNSALGVVPPEGGSEKVSMTIHDKFRLINCLFSDEMRDLAASSTNRLSREELDTGAHGAKSKFWQHIELRFKVGFPSDSVDGSGFANVVHFNHPNFDLFHESINTAEHGTHTAETLRDMWKKIQSEYDTVMVNFTKSGNHNSNFTQAAMSALGVLQVEEMEDDEDVLGSEEGVFFCFTNSVIIIYLRMWVNQNQEMAGFASRQIPSGMQIDTLDGGSSSAATKRATTATTPGNVVDSTGAKETKKPRSSPETVSVMCEVMIDLAEGRKNDAAQRAKENEARMEESMGRRASMDQIIAVSKTQAEIDLLERQIEVLQRKLNKAVDPDEKAK